MVFGWEQNNICIAFVLWGKNLGWNRHQANRNCTFYGQMLLTSDIDSLLWHLFDNTVECHCDAVQCIMILPSALPWQQQNVNQTSNSQQTPQTSPVRYAVSIVRICEQTDHIITAPLCIFNELTSEQTHISYSVKLTGCHVYFSTDYHRSLPKLLMPQAIALIYVLQQNLKKIFTTNQNSTASSRKLPVVNGQGQSNQCWPNFMNIIKPPMKLSMDE